MTRRLVVAAVLGVLAALACGVSGLGAQQPASQADLILSNGKIITVDERFTIAQAVAVRGDHIVAVGTNQEIARLAGPTTRRIDLRGRTVVPGLIDNHMHLLRYGTTWRYEVRWDGVESRKEALEMLRARTQTVKRGEWIYNLGGWAIEQFADDPKPFTREELDRVAPNHPVFLQAAYYEAYLNSRALQRLGIDVGRVPRPSTGSGRPERVEGRSGPAGRQVRDAVRALATDRPVAGIRQEDQKDFHALQQDHHALEARVREEARRVRDQTVQGRHGRAHPAQCLGRRPDRRGRPRDSVHPLALRPASSRQRPRTPTRCSGRGRCTAALTPPCSC
ncbi:MAG: amidohydrolase family protein [Chloroflexota bacterium]|nr:amidohydrolase family protein [Chloroflexota bacterium]